MSAVAALFAVAALKEIAELRFIDIRVHTQLILTMCILAFRCIRALATLESTANCCLGEVRLYAELLLGMSKAALRILACSLGEFDAHPRLAELCDDKTVGCSISVFCATSHVLA